MRKENGITLIALVITIIVLLILAGVTIATLTGDNGLLSKAGEAKNVADQANLEEEVQLALVESKTNKYFNHNSSIEDKIKAIFEKSYGQGNITVAKSGKNYKAIVKDTKIRYRIRYDGKVEKYEEMDPTSVYARLDTNGTLYLRATQIDDRYKPYTSSSSIADNLNATKDSVLYVDIEEPIAPITAYQMFDGCKNIVQINNMEIFHTENVTNMQGMFGGCRELINIDLSRFDTSKVTNMKSMFDGCNKLTNLNVSGFNTSKVTDMNWMFGNCEKITDLDVNGFDTSKVIDMNCMFYFCRKLVNLYISNFNTNNVTKMNCMFSGCGSLTNLDVSGFDTSKVTNMKSMFDGCNKLTNLDVRRFNTSSVTNMNWMFGGCGSLTNLDVRSFNTNNVTDMGSMFYGCGKLTNLEMGNEFNINAGTNIDNMFSYFTNIKIKAKQDTANKLKAKFTNFTDNNFEIVN